MTYYYKNKKITKKAAVELLGEKRLADRIKEFKEIKEEDPLTEVSWYHGCNATFEIRN